MLGYILYNFIYIYIIWKRDYCKQLFWRTSRNRFPRNGI